MASGAREYPSYGQEEGIDAGMSGLGPEMVVVVEEGPLAGHAEGDDALLGTLAQYLDVPFLDVDTHLFQVSNLGQSQPGVQHQRIQRRVPGSHRGIGIHCGEHPLYLFRG